MSEAHVTPTSPSFENALAELQQIVADLEDGRIGLEESLTRFERGIALLKTCYQVLESAEQRIEVLVGAKADGTPVTNTFDASATAPPETTTAGRRRSRQSKSEPAAPRSTTGADEDHSVLF